MKTSLFIACILLSACGEQNKCIEGRLAYRVGDSWVTPSGAYQCVEVVK